MPRAAARAGAGGFERALTCHAPDELHVVVPQLECAPRRLAHHSKRLLEQLVLRAPGREPRAELASLGRQLLVVEELDRVLQRVDAGNAHLVGRQRRRVVGLAVVRAVGRVIRRLAYGASHRVKQGQPRRGRARHGRRRDRGRDGHGPRLQRGCVAEQQEGKHLHLSQKCCHTSPRSSRDRRVRTRSRSRHPSPKGLATGAGSSGSPHCTHPSPLFSPHKQVHCTLALVHTPWSSTPQRCSRSTATSLCFNALRAHGHSQHSLTSKL